MLSASKLRWKSKQPCKYGHPRNARNTYFAGTGCNRMCRLCRDARKRGILVERKPSKYRATKCGRGHEYLPCDDFYPASYRLSAKGQRLCLICESQKVHAKRLADLRWLNGPAIEIAPLRSKLPRGKVSQWTPGERSEYDSGGRRRRNPWSTHFATPFIEPPAWQEILRLGRAA